MCVTRAESRRSRSPWRSRERRAFTLVEMVVTIAIIGLLAGLILPALWRARAKGRETDCRNNLKQFGYFLEMYRQDNDVDGYERNPPRLTYLYRIPDGTPGGREGGYVKQLELFLCSSDKSDGGEGGKPPDASQQYDELDEPTIDPNDVPLTDYSSSYMYEFAQTECVSWGGLAGPGTDCITLPDSAFIAPNTPDAFVDLDDDTSMSTWEEVKYAQMRYGDTWWNGAVIGDKSKWRGYPQTRFPVIRCFWHADDSNADNPRQVLNLSYMGHVFRSGAKWEWTALNP